MSMLRQHEKVDRLPPIISIRRITVEDVAGIVDVHRVSFPDYFLTYMGPSYLARFYRTFAEHPAAYGVVADNGDQIVGFVVGMANSSDLYARFFRENFLSLAGVLLVRFVTKSAVRKQILARKKYMVQAMRSLLTRRTGRHDARELPPNSAAAARLVSIAVIPDKRGCGIGQEMVGLFFDLLRADGVSRVGLTVREGNRQALAFYEKSGWQCVPSEGATISCERTTGVV